MKKSGPQGGKSASDLIDRFAAGVALVLSGVMAAPALALASAGVLPEADAYLQSEMRNRGIPGLAVAVVRDGRIVATQTYGLADLERNVPVTLETVFPIASLDKQITSSGILLLAQDGKVRLDDEIGQYFADPPSAWKGIRVAHLLSHASGLPDVVNGTVDGRPFTEYTTAQLLENVSRQKLLFAPGTAYEYSDAGLFLAQLITEKASGKPWRQFITERVMAPAGMSSAVFVDPTAIVKNRVCGYELSDSGTIRPNRRDAVDFGPLYNDVGATVVDFASWLAALDTDRVLPPATRDSMWNPRSRANDSFYWRDYGLGFGVDRYRGVRVVLHSGFSGVGMVVLPEKRLSVVVFTNLDNRFGTDAQGLALGVAGAYAPEVSLLAMATMKDSDPNRTDRVRGTLERLIRGEPDYGQYERPLYPSVLGSVADFSTRAPHLGELRSVAFLGEYEQDGDTLLYYRADFSKGRLFLRVGFDSAGKISCFQMIHV